MLNKLKIELYKHGMHLGCNVRYNTNLNYFILGIRFGHCVININKTLLLLKKAILFLKTLASNSGSILFYHTMFKSLNYTYKSSLLNIVLRSNQSMIIYSWLYGSINNYFFTFNRFIKDIIGHWTIDDSYLNSKNVDIINQWKLINNKKVINNKLNKRMKTTMFLKKICNNSIYNVLKQKKLFKFKYFFLKMCYLMIEKTYNYHFYNKEDNIDGLNNKLNKKILFYWRLLLYYNNFKTFFELPDAFFCVSPDNNDLPLREVANSGEIVTIGLVDTNSKFEFINYPIICNDDSIIIAFFFFYLFNNIFLETQLSIYNQFK